MSSKTQNNTPDAESLAIIGRLRRVFNIVHSVLSGDRVGRLWAVYGQIGGQPPTVESVESREDLHSLISALRVASEPPDAAPYYIHIFFGQRWQIKKGRTWQLWDGEAFEAIDAVVDAEDLDASGILASGVDLDSLLPRAAPQAPENEAAPPA